MKIDLKDIASSGSLFLGEAIAAKPAELAAMARKTVTMKQQDGRAVTYEGTLVAELSKRAGAPRDLAGARSIRMLERIELVRLPKQ
jgi:hypothetical protein